MEIVHLMFLSWYDIHYKNILTLEHPDIQCWYTPTHNDELFSELFHNIRS